MNKTVIRIPPSPLYDMEAMESWLTDMAREGLYLERQGIDWGLGHFYRGTSGAALSAGVLSGTPHPVATSSAKPPRPQPGGQGTGRPGRWEYVSLHQSFYVYRATTEHPGRWKPTPA